MNAWLARARAGANAPQPARVREEIARSQRESEIWVAAAQIIVIALAALAYAFTPRGFSPDTPIAALPLGLVALLLLIVLRAWFAASGQLSRPVLAASVIAEMAVLLALLWGFAPQYETTLAIALKNALFAAIFVLIALRALRFKPVDLPHAKLRNIPVHAVTIQSGFWAPTARNQRQQEHSQHARSAGGERPYEQFRRLTGKSGPRRVGPYIPTPMFTSGLRP